MPQRGEKTKIPSKFWNIVLKFSSELLNLLGLVWDPLCRGVCSSHPLPCHIPNHLSSIFLGDVLHPRTPILPTSMCWTVPAVTPRFGRLLQTTRELRRNTIQTWRNADFTPPVHQRGAGFYHDPLRPRAQGYVQHK